jgi:CheY-like chemotaxis protein
LPRQRSNGGALGRYPTTEVIITLNWRSIRSSGQPRVESLIAPSPMTANRIPACSESRVHHSRRTKVLCHVREAKRSFVTLSGSVRGALPKSHEKRTTNSSNRRRRSFGAPRNCETYTSERLRRATFERPGLLLASKVPKTNACLVLDVDLPEMNGVELYEALEIAGRALPVIMITGKSDSKT